MSWTFALARRVRAFHALDPTRARRPLGIAGLASEIYKGAPDEIPNVTASRGGEPRDGLPRFRTLGGLGERCPHHLSLRGKRIQHRCRRLEPGSVVVRPGRAALHAGSHL